jgi:hypothetical protein
MMMMIMNTRLDDWRKTGVPRNFVRGGGSINSVEDRGQREQGSGDGSPVVRGSAEFENE